jgi:hypothetical protein
MRRAKAEVTDKTEIEGILARAEVLYLGVRDEEAPYVVPVNFGFEKGTLYVHSALRGAKIDLLRSDPRVGFSAHADLQIVAGKTACDFSARATSVVGRGRARIVQDEAEKVRGLDAIMRHYGAAHPVYRQESLSRTNLIAIDIDSIRGKRIG